AYAREGGLYSHLNWHCTLGFLEAGERERALAVNAERLRPSATLAPPINKVCDSTALLWRIALADPLPPGTWDEQARYASTQFPGPAHHFIEWHIAMVLAA